MCGGGRGGGGSHCSPEVPGARGDTSCYGVGHGHRLSACTCRLGARESREVHGLGHRGAQALRTPSAFLQVPSNREVGEVRGECDRGSQPGGDEAPDERHASHEQGNEDHQRECAHPDGLCERGEKEALRFSPEVPDRSSRTVHKSTVARGSRGCRRNFRRQRRVRVLCGPKGRELLGCCSRVNSGHASALIPTKGGLTSSPSCSPLLSPTIGEPGGELPREGCGGRVCGGRSGWSCHEWRASPRRTGARVRFRAAASDSSDGAVTSGAFRLSEGSRCCRRRRRRAWSPPRSPVGACPPRPTRTRRWWRGWSQAGSVRVGGGP